MGTSFTLGNRRLAALVAGDDTVAGRLNDDRLDDAEFADRAAKLLHLSGGNLAGIVGGWFERLGIRHLVAH